MNFIQHNGVIRQPRRRRSSLLDRWIQEQQLTTVPSTDLTPTNNHEFFPSIGTDSNPYLAYPHLSRVSFQPILDDVGTLRDYGSVDDVNLPPVPQVHRSTIELPPSSSYRSKSSRRPSLLNLRPSFRSSSPFAQTFMDTTPCTPPRVSLFSRKLRSGGRTNNPFLKHARSSSLPNPNDAEHQYSPPSESTSNVSTTPSSWKWRPALRHLSFSSRSQFRDYPAISRAPSSPSRPSTSSYTSATPTSLDDDVLPLPPLSGSSPRKFFKFAAGSASSPSLWSQPTTRSISSNSNGLRSQPRGLRMFRVPIPKSRLAQEADDDDDEYDDDDNAQQVYDHNQPVVVYAANDSQDVSRLLLGSFLNKKKKKLVIRGIRINERKKFDAVKRWCETFGEVSQIVRMPNEDLHVDFKSAEVAETVCRIHAHVFISGAGSVHLSWYRGNKP